MIENNGVFLTTRLRQMIRKYAKNPDLFFSNGGVNNEYIDRLINQYIEILPERRKGQACIKGTRAAVCDIITDTWHLANSKNYLLRELYAPILTNETIDAAYAFLMRSHDKVAKDFCECNNSKALPKDLYS